MRHNKLGMFMLFVTVALFAGCKPNLPPNAQAGFDQIVDVGDKVTLRGSASDPDGMVHTYRWKQIAGPSVSISNENQASASFVAPKVEGDVTLTFRLRVTDDDNATATDKVMVTIAKYGRLGITLSGIVKNHATYRGISGGTITVSQYQGQTSRRVGEAKTTGNGNYSVQARVNPGRLTVNANAAGFAPHSIIVDVSDGSRRTADLSMIPVQVTQPFRLENNAAIKVDGQTVVSLSANALVTDSGGAASGQATAMVTVLDASKDPSVMPGDLEQWNADVLYESITLKGCVQDQKGKPVRNAEVTARGKDYVGSSKATTDADGQFEVEVRPDSELELSAAVDGSVYSDAQTMRTEGVDLSLGKCLVVTGDQGIRDFPMKIKVATGSLKICVRDHECEDGDKISVDVEGRTIFSGEIFNEWDCQTLEVRGGETYVVELTALNGTGYLME